MKQFLALMALLFVAVLAIWVAMRLAPETWAMMAGVIFGILASLPMAAIVFLLLRREQRAARPAETGYYAPRPRVLLDAEPLAYPPGERRLPDARYYLPPAPPRRAARPDADTAPYAYAPARPAPPAPPAWDHWGPDGNAEATAPWETDGGEYAAWETAPRPRGARILGQ
jgi:hypothetical protein